MRCSTWSLDPTPRRPTTLVYPRRGAETTFAHRGCIRNSTHPSYPYCLLYVARTAASWCVSGHGLAVALLRGRIIWVKKAALRNSHREAGCAQHNTQLLSPQAKFVFARL